MKQSNLQRLRDISAMHVALPLVVALAISIGFIGVRVMAADSSTTTNMSANCEVTCVEVRDSGFSPSELAIKTGEYVQFNSKDKNRHNLALGNGIELSTKTTHDEPIEEHGHIEGTPAEHSHDEETREVFSHNGAHDHEGGSESGEFGIGEAWRVQFKRPGTYIIHDHLYAGNSVLVVVYDSTNSAN